VAGAYTADRIQILKFYQFAPLSLPDLASSSPLSSDARTLEPADHAASGATNPPPVVVPWRLLRAYLILPLPVFHNK
jgi:hypothetical protein